MSTTTMSSVEIGKATPDCTLQATGDQNISLSDFKGKSHLVLYFYPKDSTPGCTTEGQNFRDNKEAFDSLDTTILGVSREKIKSHENFKAKQEFNFDLLCDPEEELCKLFDVIKEKNMYGRKYMGVERSTFLINKEGMLVKEWRKVKVKGHVDEVLEAVREL